MRGCLQKLRVMKTNGRIIRTGSFINTHRGSQASPRRGIAETRPVVAFRHRSAERNHHRDEFNAPEVWHEPVHRSHPKYLEQPAGNGFRHPVTMDEVRARLAELPACLTRNLDVVQLSTMTRKRRTAPCYGMQWGTAVYLYPIEENLTEQYVRPPKPQQEIEARMFGGEWKQTGQTWSLLWTPEAIRNFYLNNVLIHEIGHLNDHRNSNPAARERFANWFAIEYGYRPARREAVAR